MMSLLPTVPDVPSSTYDRADAAARQLVGQAFLVPLLKEVRESMECGMAFENYSDIQEGDMIECFEITEVARTLD